MDSNHSDKQILVVDDEVLNIKILEILLGTDYCILAATNGEDALRIAGLDNPPDLILLDIVMPEMDGYEVCKRLKQSAKTRNIPVIFITAKAEVEDEARGLQFGAVDYIVRPFSGPIVRARVKAHLMLKQQRDDLMEMARNLEQLNQTKNKFVCMAAHDLRNPLICIRGFSELLIQEAFGPVPDDQQQAIHTIHSTAQDMLMMVNDLLDISMIESGKLALRLEKGSLNTLLAERISLNRILSDRKKIVIDICFKDQVDAVFDHKRLGQAVDNLISNAIKYSPEGSSIYITLRAERDEAIIDVRDEGPGISKEDQAKIFGEFQKLSARPTAGESSTGLGLAIAKKIIGTHGGVLYIESELGRGATFSITLPLGTIRPECCSGGEAASG